MQLGARTTGGLVSVRIATGGAGYTSAPSVSFSGGGGTGAAGFAQMAGSLVSSVHITTAGTGYTSNPSVAFSGGGGTGAAATAYACTGSLRPMTFFKGRGPDVYGVDGMGRGIRWDGAASSAQPIGLLRPATSVAVSAAATTAGRYVKSVQMVYGGAGYYGTPTVQFTGGTPTVPAEAVATIVGGRVTEVRITKPGSGYQATPQVSITGGLASGAALSAGVIGSIAAVRITASGSAYTDSATTSPTVVLGNTQGLTGALVSVSVDQAGRIASANVLSGGTGATTTGVTASVTGGSGSGASLSLEMQYAVNAVTVATSGAGYYVPPVLTFRPAALDPSGTGAVAEAAVNSVGQITGVTVINGGAYSLPPSVVIESTNAEAQAELATPLTGQYQCCIRYIDGTPRAEGGPIASSISDLVTVDTGTGAGGITWTFSHGHIDDRVSAMELWRTTSGQSVILFRVATIARSSGSFSTSYLDTLTDSDLRDTKRDGYALMPVTLPSGQVNARRFGVPPGEFAVGCMFQDRAWYAVDSTGVRQNALMYSEVDEPESVPEVNELVLQENTGEADRIVALIPLGGALLVAQTSHLYKLSYVAQPVIDASVLLVGYRGALNSRCWGVLGGVAFIADSVGLYAFDGSNEEALSVAVDDYWRDGKIDFSKADLFHVSVDTQTRTVRFHYCSPADTGPVRALCYCVATKAWWEETYPSAVTATCRAMLGGKLLPVKGTAAGDLVKESGTTDAGTSVPYRVRTGAFALAPSADGNRSVDVLYAPTTSDATLNLSLHYNNSTQPRANAIATDRGGAFVTTTGATAATLNLKRSRSALGDATGHAKAYFSGRPNDRSVGADKHVAVDLSGSQESDRIVLHAIAVDGVG